MTAPSLLEELEAVALLAERATPGCWTQDTGGDITRDDGSTLFSREKPDGDNAASFANADYVEAAVNFIRTHHAEIAEAVKDARRYRMTRHKLTCGKLTVDEELSIIGAKDGQAFDATIDAMHNSAREDGE